MSRPISAEFTTDMPLHDHAYVRVNGKLCQLNFLPAWTERPARQPALWVSEEAARLIEWALTIAPSEKAGIYHRRRLAGEFCPAEAMEEFCGTRPAEGETEAHKARQAWWKAINKELRDANLLAEVGHGWYAPTSLAADFFPPPAAVRALTNSTA